MKKFGTDKGKPDRTEAAGRDLGQPPHFLDHDNDRHTCNNPKPASPHHLRPARRQPRRSLAAKKGTGEIEVTKKVKGNPQLLLRVPPELQKPLADESAKTGESRQGVLWRIAAKYFKGRKA